MAGFLTPVLSSSAGDFNRWITRFEDQEEVCETIGLEISEEAKIYHFMNNLNDLLLKAVRVLSFMFLLKVLLVRFERKFIVVVFAAREA